MDHASELRDIGRRLFGEGCCEVVIDGDMCVLHVTRDGARDSFAISRDGWSSRGNEAAPWKIVDVEDGIRNLAERARVKRSLPKIAEGLRAVSAV